MKKTFILRLCSGQVFNLYIASFIPCLLLAGAGLYPTNAFAVDVAPRISDREIIEGLANIRGDMKELRAGQNALLQQINDLKESSNKRFDDVNNRFNDVNKRFDDVNRRFDTIQWMLGLFITVALSIMGIMGRILWNQQKKMTQIETSLETQKDELSFLKTLIEKLLSPKGVV